MQHFNLDAIDKQLCEALQYRGRAHYNELAEKVGLSVPAVSERIRKLEERGIIMGFYAKLNPKAFHLDITAFVFVTVEGSANFASFIKKCQKRGEILDCHAITGEASHILKVRTHNTETLERLLSDLQKWDGVKRTLTNIVFSTNKETAALPIDL